MVKGMWSLVAGPLTFPEEDHRMERRKSNLIVCFVVPVAEFL